MNIHNTIEVVGDLKMDKDGLRFTRDRLGKKHTVESPSTRFTKNNQSGKVDTWILKGIFLFPIAMLVFFFIVGQRIAHSEDISAAESISKGKKFVVESNSQDMFRNINGTESESRAPLLDALNTSVGDDAKVGFNEDGDPSLSMQF